MGSLNVFYSALALSGNYFLQVTIDPLTLLQTAPFSGANIAVYWLRAHALGTDRDIEVNILNKTFEQKGAKKHLIFTTIRVYKRLRWAGGASSKVVTA